VRGPLADAGDLLIERPSTTPGAALRSLTSWSVGLFYGAVLGVIIAVSLFSEP
jgi:hypothetical protein